MCLVLLRGSKICQKKKTIKMSCFCQSIQYYHLSLRVVSTFSYVEKSCVLQIWKSKARLAEISIFGNKGTNLEIVFLFKQSPKVSLFPNMSSFPSLIHLFLFLFFHLFFSFCKLGTLFHLVAPKIFVMCGFHSLTCSKFYGLLSLLVSRNT